MNSLTTHYRRSQLIALPVPGGKAKVEYCYAVNVPGDREIVTHSFAEWAVGDFNRQKETVLCDKLTVGSKITTECPSNEIRLMCVQDGRTHKQICEMYSRVSRDPFWCRNVLSPSKLREKWDELSLRLSPSVSTHTEKREDPYFKASYDNVDYSQIPAGFRG